MADNIAVTEGAGKTIAADEIASVLYQRIKLVLGDDGVNGGDVSPTNPMPTKLQTAASSTLATAANSASTFVVLAANAARKGFMIFNDSSVTVTYAFAATASAAAFTFRLTAGASYIYNLPVIYTGIVSAISPSATGNQRTTELT
jgi:hypothetical protein